MGRAFPVLGRLAVAAAGRRFKVEARLKATAEGFLSRGRFDVALGAEVFLSRTEGRRTAGRDDADRFLLREAGRGTAPFDGARFPRLDVGFFFGATAAFLNVIARVHQNGSTMVGRGPANESAHAKWRRAAIRWATSTPTFASLLTARRSGITPRKEPSVANWIPVRGISKIQLTAPCRVVLIHINNAVVATHFCAQR